ncbi:hypothetical protein PENSPDRAFT_633810 [Peniophora sp. CONT]|nr:hypothetical protein PENSPDRAFT_633810 [Peniophora sp. CONT]
MSHYSYFEEDAQRLMDSSFSFNLPFHPQHEQSQMDSCSSKPGFDVPSYNSLYDCGPPPGPPSHLRDCLTYSRKSFDRGGLPEDCPPSSLPPREVKGPVPHSDLYSTTQRPLPPYVESLDEDDGVGEVLERAPLDGLPSPPLPLTPPPKYEAQSQIKEEEPQAYFSSPGKRKALCIGINYYTGRRGEPELRGCVSDAKNMHDLLIERYQYWAKDMLLLTDEPGQHPMLIPTRSNIIRAMEWLVRGAQPGDSLVFQYAGHGSQVKDTDGDEDDELDETICPVDYEEEGVGPIIDDDLHNILVKPLPPGCRLTAIYDSCHSGSALDLPHLYSNDDERDGVLRSVNERSIISKASPADVICWSACKDNEKAADTKTSGAMSQAFLSALSGGREHSYESLFMAINGHMRSRRLYAQKPQLSSSHPMDISQMFTM